MRPGKGSRSQTQHPIARSRPTGRGHRRGGLRALFGRSQRNRRRGQRKPAAGQVSATRDANEPSTKRNPGLAQNPPRWHQVLSGVLLAARLVICATLLIGVGWLGYRGYQLAASSTYFTVQQIEITGTERAQRAELLQRVQWVLGRALLRVDKRELARAVTAHPWVARAQVTRRLPHTLHMRVVEHTAHAVLLLGHLYLVNPQGVVFKRATLGEADGLPVISGIRRLDYLNGAQRAANQLQHALQALVRYRRPGRPSVGEVHVSADGETTLFLQRGGTALRFGQQITETQLSKLDAVWAALGPDVRRARAVYLDHEHRNNRVVVRMASSH